MTSALGRELTKRSRKRLLEPTRACPTSLPTTFTWLRARAEPLPEGKVSQTVSLEAAQTGQTAVDPAEGETLGDANLRSRVLHGLAWNAALVVTVQIARLSSGLVLVRLLQPHDYGIAGMALLGSGFVLAISDLGLGAALVQRPSI